MSRNELARPVIGNIFLVYYVFVLSMPIKPWCVKAGSQSAISFRLFSYHPLPYFLVNILALTKARVLLLSALHKAFTILKAQH